MQTAKHFIQCLNSALWSSPMLLPSAVIFSYRSRAFLLCLAFFSCATPRRHTGVLLTTFLSAISNKSSFGVKGHFSFTYLQRCSCF